MFYWLGGENGKQMLRWKTRCFIGWEVRMGNRPYGGRHVVYCLEVRMGNRPYGGRHVVLLVGR